MIKKAKKTDSKTKTTDKVNKKSIPEQLRRWNLGIAAILFAEALTVVAFGKSVSLPVTTQYLSVDQLATEANGHEVLNAATRHLFDVPVVGLVVALLLLLAVAHALMATVYRKRYEAGLESGVSKLRWATYGVVGGVMLLVISMLSGIYQLSSLIMLFVLVLMGCNAAWVTEKLAAANSKKDAVSRVVYALSVKGVFVPWVVLALGVCGAMMYGGNIPAYLYGIYTTSVLFVLAFALLTHYRIQRKGKWADTYKAERAYMVLGLGAVSLLAWQIFAGVL